MSNHISAIHTIKSRVQMSEDDYRALLHQLTGVESCKGMSAPQLQSVREHFDKIARAHGLRPKTGKGNALSPKERMVWHLWMLLAQAECLDNSSSSALRSYIRNRTGKEYLQWCNAEELDALINQMRMWLKRLKK